jgi:hypothetical protein
MNLIPTISDYDLYLFVFHPEQLSDGKREYIAGNKKYVETLDHFRELAMTTNDSITDSDRELLSSKIGVYRPHDNIIYLYPHLSHADGKKQTKVQYRAASVEVDESITSKTFFDDKKHYMVKANINHRSTRIYIFSNSGETLHNITLRVHPARTLHHLDDNTQPLILDGRVEIEHISLEFGEE